MNLLIKIVLMCFIFYSNILFARTRDDVIREANAYKNYEWKVGPNNILDVQTHYPDKSPVDNKPDGKDDRAWKYNPKTSEWEYSTDNWPFEKDMKVTGEAYAWAGWVGNIQWGGDTTNLFSQRLKDSVNKWIAGAREEDCHTTNIQKIIKGGYKGYTGIDCSGFISRLWKPTNTLFKISTESMSNYCVKIPFLDLKPGDILRS